MNDYGFKVSLPGYDVGSATPEQCAVHSSYPPFKSKTNQNPPHFATVSVDFTGVITQDLTQTLYSISHGYSYIPFTIANIVFVDSSGGTEVGIGFAGVGSTLAINAYCDSTNFYVTIYDNFNWTGANATLDVSYYIFCEEGT
jgi:hypothetical protein